MANVLRQPKKYGRLVAKMALTLLLIIIFALGGLVVSAQQAGLSLPAQTARLLLPFMLRDGGHTPDDYLAEIKANRSSEDGLPSDGLRAKFHVQETITHDYPVFTVSPRESANDRLRILYLHGGSYLYQVSAFQWGMAAEVIERTQGTLVMPLYPLAPEQDWQPAHAMVTAVYEALVAEVGADNIVIMGDSSGGGLTLALAQQWRDAKRPLPAALVLLSPWLDVTLSDPTQAALDRRDPMLSIPALRFAGELWAGELDPGDPRISPLFGAMDGLPPMAVFTGTEDLLYPDAQRLALKVTAAGGQLRLFEYRNEFHVWMQLLPDLIPEAGRAFDQIAAFILAA